MDGSAYSFASFGLLILFLFDYFLIKGNANSMSSNVLNKWGLGCSLISACSTCVLCLCSLSWLDATVSPERATSSLSEQVEICCTLLIGQSAFQTRRRHHTRIRSCCKPGVDRRWWPLWPRLVLFCIVWATHVFICRTTCVVNQGHFFCRIIQWSRLFSFALIAVQSRVEMKLKSDFSS